MCGCEHSHSQSGSIYVASKDIYRLQYTPLSLSVETKFSVNTEVVVRYVSFLCVTKLIFKNLLFCSLIVYNVPENGCKVLCSTFGNTASTLS